MKILQICNKVPYPVKDGGALAIHNLAKGFAEAGNEVFIMAMHTQKHASDKLLILNYFKSLNIKIELIEVDSEITALKALLNLLFSRLPYNATRFITKKFNKSLKNLLAENSFDIIQLEGAYLTPYLKTIKKLSQAKISYRAHNIEHEIWRRYAREQVNLFKTAYISILARRIQLFEKEAINGYDLIVPITYRDYFSFQKMGNIKPACVCPYAFDFVKEDINNDLLTFDKLFFIGSLDWLPNQEGLLWFINKVWPGIQAKVPFSSFFIAGRNAPFDFVEKLKKKNIYFLGEVESASEFIKDKQILIAPLFSGSGMRVKIVEAMALGKTVITTTIGAEGIDVTHNENILIADNVLDFENAIFRILADKDFSIQIGKNAARFVKEHLDNRKVIQGLINFYKMHL